MSWSGRFGDGDKEWAECLGSGGFACVPRHHPRGVWHQDTECTEGIVPRPTLGLSHQARRDQPLKRGAGGGVSGWHLAVPPEHFQATCGFWMWEVPLMQAGVRGILFNVLGGGREGRGNREGRA